MIAYLTALALAALFGSLTALVLFVVLAAIASSSDYALFSLVVALLGGLAVFGVSLVVLI